MLRMETCPVSKTALKHLCEDYGIKYTGKQQQQQQETVTKKSKTKVLAIPLGSAFQTYCSNPD